MENNNWIYETLDLLKTGADINANWTAPRGPKTYIYNIDFNIDNQLFTFKTDLKNEIRDNQLPALQEQMRKNKPYIIVARKIFPKVREKLRENEIPYLEGNGNFYLKKGKTFVWIDGNKPLPDEKPAVNRAFTKTGLKLVFEILQDESLLNRPYREMAAKAGIALGNVNNIINALKDMKFLVRMDKKDWKITGKKELLQRWLTYYPEKLKPDLKIGTFRFLKEEEFNAWQRLELKKGKTWWGGEPAGDLITHYLRPGRLTMYTLETREEIIRNYRLVPDENGNIDVFQVFWEVENTNTWFAPPLLVYTDLINTGDQRCIETAQKVYDEYLAISIIT